MKIICQNCFEILAERNKEKDIFRFDADRVDSIVQDMDIDTSMLTLCCPKCGCMLQVKV